MSKMEIQLWVASVIILLLPGDCLAYLDLGTGSYIVQLAVATALGACLR